MTAAQAPEPVVMASLRALVEPPEDAATTVPRDILVAVSEAWADDATAWRLARRLIPHTEAYMAELDREAQLSPRSEDIARMRRRARYAHYVAVALYRDLRMPARRSS